jgi:hypothetical protein
MSNKAAAKNKVVKHLHALVREELLAAKLLREELYAPIEDFAQALSELCDYQPDDDSVEELSLDSEEKAVIAAEEAERSISEADTTSVTSAELESDSDDDEGEETESESSDE